MAGWVSAATAQDDQGDSASISELGEQKVTIDELRSPTSPAFTILGVAPTNVVRPNSPRELAVDVLSAKQNGDGDLPTDFALEFAPYWLFDHPELTFDQYYSERGIGKTILRSFSVSLATADIPDEGVEGTTLGVGIRFLLFAGDKHPDMDGKVRALKDVQLKFLENCIPDIEDDDRGAGGTELRETTIKETTTSELALTCPADFAAYSEQFAKAASAVSSLQRTGWVVEAALAASRDYPDADGESSRSRQAGAWVTASYKMRDPSELTLLAAARLLEDRTGEEKARIKDIGARLIYEPTHMPVSLSLEVMHRDIEHGDSETSVLGVLEYPINETLRLVASYGKGLPTPTNDSDLQATISLNFGFGKGPSVAFRNLPP